MFGSFNDIDNHCKYLESKFLEGLQTAHNAFVASTSDILYVVSDNLMINHIPCGAARRSVSSDIEFVALCCCGCVHMSQVQTYFYYH